MNSIVAILAGLSFYLIPVLTGSAALAIFKKKVRFPFGLFFSFCIGALILYVYSLILIPILNLFPNYDGPKIFRVVSAVFISLILVLNILFILKNLAHILTLIKKILPQGLFIFLLAITAFMIWKWNTPYGQILNWDIFEHQTIINNIKNGQMSFVTSEISDTFQFNGYSSIFHALAALPQIIYQPDVLLFWWWIEFFHFVTTIIISYILVKTVTRNFVMAILGAIIGAFIFESFVIYSSLLLVPQTLAAVLIVTALSYSIHMLKNNHRISLTLLILAFLVILLTHYIVGIAGILLVLTVIIISKSKNLHQKWYPYTLLISLMTVFFTINFFASNFDLSNINSGEAAAFTHTVSTKFEYAKVFYGLTMFIIFPFGIAASIANLKSPTDKALLVVTFIVMTIVFSTAPYVLKFYVLGRYLTHIYLAIGIGFAISKFRSKLTQALLTCITLLTFISILIYNAAYWKDSIRYKNEATLISDDEIKAALFLKKHFSNTNVLVISDPATQHVLEPFSEVNTQGGAYMLSNSRESLINALFSDNKLDFRKNISAVKDDIIRQKPDYTLLVISGRTRKWQYSEDKQQLSLGFNIWSPQALTFNDLRYVDYLEREFSLNRIYENLSLVIFEIPKGGAI